MFKRLVIFFLFHLYRHLKHNCIPQEMQDFYNFMITSAKDLMIFFPLLLKAGQTDFCWKCYHVKYNIGINYRILKDI